MTHVERDVFDDLLKWIHEIEMLTTTIRKRIDLARTNNSGDGPDE